ncbi:winged helix-turn-helix domain-containing protein [Kluyvera ascorbata]|uniref:winged helix-turn-helix domain-containing protein n=1 Tax=Kluyvera ascorbata TaxID=51288 RepID=UPI00204D7F26|nr:helix-turn-helix domain-containing protein [Kluyvera ascorbata]UPQ69817.1 helix-turn-helix domain-containing protein [Kluyvera ascorbata]
MVFRIGSLIMYRTDDGAMWLATDESTDITLTVTMNRLLSFLLARRGQVVARDEILENVWDVYGLRSSNNTLNKYISEIRKQFVAFGLHDECITTIPRIGFMFSGDVDVQIIQECTNTTLANVANNAEVGKSKSKNHKEINYFYSVLVITLSLVVILMSLLVREKTHLLDENNPIEELSTYHLFDFKNCPVYTTQKNADSLSENKKDIFIKMVTKEGLSCLPGTVFLYQVSESYLYGKEGRVFINRCTTNSDGFISCLNYYWNGYEQSK